MAEEEQLMGATLEDLRRAAANLADTTDRLRTSMSANGRVLRRQQAPSKEGWTAVTGFLVAAVGLVVLLAVVGLAVITLPNDSTKGQSVVTLATASFGVIGAVTGAFFAVRTANKAVEQSARR